MNTQQTCSIISLGCPKNLVDSESMIGRLTSAGFEFRPTIENVDLAILNTCGFLKSARDEAIEYLNELLELRRCGTVRAIIVTGCLIKRIDAAELTERWPQVDAWISPFDEQNIVSIAQTILQSRQNKGSVNSNDSKKLSEVSPTAVEKSNSVVPPLKIHSKVFSTDLKVIPMDDRQRRILTCPHTAYLKIADGCDRFCSYCSIPFIRGRFCSKPIETILEEAQRLAEQGVKELVLIAQETSFWGSDLYGKAKLPELLAKLRELSGIRWIRVLYTHPLHFNDELIDFFADEAGRFAQQNQSERPILLPYIDIPLQHGNNEILKRMNRSIGKDETEELLSKLRQRIPGLILRTSFIVGFPDETDEQFNELLEFAQRWKFERAGAFSYSAEPGTRAAEFENQIPAKVKKIRFRQLSKLLEQNVIEYGRTLIGSICPVIIDQHVLDDNGEPIPDFFLGRTYADSPDIDPRVYVTGSDLKVGDIHNCEIVDLSGLDLIAVPEN